MLGVIPDETGRARLFIEADAVFVVIYGDTPVERDGLLNAAESFSSARRVFVSGFAHWDCVSDATEAGTGSVALIAAGLAAVVFVVPGMVSIVGRSVVPIEASAGSGTAGDS